MSHLCGCGMGLPPPATLSAATCAATIQGRRRSTYTRPIYSSHGNRCNRAIHIAAGKVAGSRPRYGTKAIAAIRSVDSVCSIFCRLYWMASYLSWSTFSWCQLSSTSGPRCPSRLAARMLILTVALQTNKLELIHGSVACSHRPCTHLDFKPTPGAALRAAPPANRL